MELWSIGSLSYRNDTCTNGPWTRDLPIPRGRPTCHFFFGRGGGTPYSAHVNSWSVASLRSRTWKGPFVQSHLHCQGGICVPARHWQLVTAVSTVMCQTMSRQHVCGGHCLSLNCCIYGPAYEAAETVVHSRITGHGCNQTRIVTPPDSARYGTAI